MRITLDLNSVTDYDLFLRIKALPAYEFRGRTAIIKDEYAARLGVPLGNDGASLAAQYNPLPSLYDYQIGVSSLAIRKRKFAIFAECGLGKTLMLLEYARHVDSVLAAGKRILMVSPLMVVKQTIGEARRFYGDSLPIEQVRAAGLAAWMGGVGGRIGITNYEALTEDIPQGLLGCLILDESSMLKSAYGKQGTECIRLGRGLDWKLALTGTPAPNDRVEFANHAVFLDAFPNVNSFLARFFINRGETQERWELKPHALRPFYRALSDWCIFLSNPATYGWKDNADTLPPIHTHIHEVELTAAQQLAVRRETGMLFGAGGVGGITSRSKLSQLAKGKHRGEKIETNKPEYIRSLVHSWRDSESTILWCKYNDEQETMEAMFPGAASIAGPTPIETRERLIAEFQAGGGPCGIGRRELISKPRILGFGLNLQVATRQIFSGLEDSWEEFHQAVKRSNRVGSTRDLNVHIPVTEIEMPMVQNVLRKAARIQADVEEQERMFKDEATF